MRVLVYGDVLGSFVFLTKERAEDLEALYKVLRPGLSWRAFRKQVPARIIREIVRIYGKQADDEAWALPADGDWPFPQQEQIDLLPKDVLELGVIESTVFNGDVLQLSPSKESEILKRLRAHGFTVTRDDRLVCAACDTA